MIHPRVLKINLFLKRIKKTVDSLKAVCYIDGVQIRHNNLSATAKEVCVTNKKMLRSIMMRHGDTNASLAKYLGITEQSVSNKINENGTEFKQGEIAKIKVKYNLDSEAIDQIFFAEEVS